MPPTYIDPKTKKPVDLSSFGDAGAQNLQANKLGLDIAPTGAITASSLAPATAITIPPKQTPVPVDTTTGQAVIDAQMPAITTPPTEPPPTEPPKEPSAIDSFLSGLKAPGSQAEAYKTAYGASGLATQEQDVLEKQRVVKTAQGKLAAINAQLGAINAEATAIPIQVQKEATGRGITAAGAAPITTARLRENALKALPLQAQALAAQAEVQTAQGDVELAQNSMKMASDRLTTMFSMQVKDMENEYNYNKDLRDKVYQYATAKEKAQLDAMNKEDDRNFELMKDNINNAQTLSKTALDAGQADLAARITQLDPKSKTYTQDLATLQGEIRPDTTDKLYKQLQIQKLQQELAKKGRDISDLSTSQQTAAFKLADDYEAASKSYFTQRDAYNRVVASAQDPSAAGDLALIFNYMKVLDPGSVVREGEFATAQSAGSVPERIIGQYNKVLSGERLAETQRKDFVDRAGKLFTSAENQQKTVDTTYGDRAEKYGIPKDFVIRDISSSSISVPPPTFISDDEVAKLSPAALTTGITLEENPSGFFDGFLNMFGLKKK